MALMQYAGKDADGTFCFKGQSALLRPVVYVWLVEQFGNPGHRFVYYWDTNNAITVTVRGESDAMAFRMRWT